MNIIILLLSLLSPYVSPSPPNEMLSAAIPSTPPVMQAFEHVADYTPYISSFDSMEGVSLYMTESELLLTKGSPLRIVADPWQGCLEYQYEDMSAGLCQGEVLYIHVTPAQAEQYGLELNGMEIDPANHKLRELLGAADFAAEDGDVYLRGNAALKIYRNASTGEWDGIDLFDKNSS